MKLKPFELRLDKLSGEEIGVAVWSALLANAWSLYSTQLMYLATKGTDIRALDDTEKGRIAKGAFAYVAELLPENNPYRRELERYAVEAVPGTVGSLPPPFPN